MDKQLHELKAQFKRDIPTAFTDRDRSAILEKVSTGRKNKHIVPQAFTAVFCAALVFIGLVMTNDQLHLVEIGGSAANMSDQGGAELSIYLEKGPENYLTFDPGKVQVGNFFGEVEVKTIRKHNNQTTITFNVNQKMTGDLYNNGELMLFVPNKEAIANIPFAVNDLGGDISFFFHHIDKVKRIYGINEDPTPVWLKDVTIKVDQLEYFHTPEHSFIHLRVQK